jgi:hypothetical protein
LRRCLSINEEIIISLSEAIAKRKEAMDPLLHGLDYIQVTTRVTKNENPERLEKETLVIAA